MRVAHEVLTIVLVLFITASAFDVAADYRDAESDASVDASALATRAAEGDTASAPSPSSTA